MAAAAVGALPPGALVRVRPGPGEEACLGVVLPSGTDIVVVPPGPGRPTCVGDVTRAGGLPDDAVDADELPGLPLSDVELLAPVARPPTVLCVGKNYRAHAAEVDERMKGISKPGDASEPAIIFTKAPLSVVGPFEDIVLPHPDVSTKVDFEGELGVVIGRGGRGIKREDAMSFVFGYTVLNDVTARDLQKDHQQWYLGKSQDTFCPLGPCVVPAAALNPPGGGEPDLAVRTFVNGELRQDGRTTDMIHTIADLIATISAGITLQPGDVIATGTPAGVGAAADPPTFLQPGDVVRVEVEGVGAIENPVVAAR